MRSDKSVASCQPQVGWSCTDMRSVRDFSASNSTHWAIRRVIQGCLQIRVGLFTCTTACCRQVRSNYRVGNTKCKILVFSQTVGTFRYHSFVIYSYAQPWKNEVWKNQFYQRAKTSMAYRAHKIQILTQINCALKFKLTVYLIIVPVFVKTGITTTCIHRRRKIKADYFFHIIF